MSEENAAESTPAPSDSSTAGLQKMSIWEVYYPSKLDEDKEAIPVASFPMIIYFWPSLLAFLLCGILQSLGWASEGTLGWVATCSLAFNLLVIVTDLDQKKFMITILGVVVLGLGAWISNMKGLPVVGALYAWIGGLELHYSNDVLWVISGFLGLFLFVGLIQPRFNYWRMEPNEFVHYVQPWGRDQSIPRQGSTVTREVPDVLELLLTFGGGTLVIRRDNQVVARIEHVPFLGRRMVAIERLLGVTRVRHVES